MLSKIYPVERFRTFDRFNRMMEEMFGPGNGALAWAPAVDIKETDAELSFACELPGVEPKDIEVEVGGELLTISGKREFSNEEKKDDFVRIERSYGNFQRSFSLPGPVHPDEVEAQFANGMLTIKVPKRASVAAGKVQVKIN